MKEVLLKEHKTENRQEKTQRKTEYQGTVYFFMGAVGAKIGVVSFGNDPPSLC